MPMLRAIRLLNAVEAGTTSGAQLESLLVADAGRLAEFNVLINQRGQARRIASSATTMAAVIASSTAMAAVIASSTAMAAVAASSTAMAAVAASSTAMAAVAASSTAMAAVAASSTATSAISANVTANNMVLGSSYSVGAYLDEVAVNGGALTNSTLRAQATMAAVAASSTAMAAVAASSTAMAAVWASNSASTAVMSNSTARLAVYNSDAALAALQAAPTQVQNLVTSLGVTNTNSWAGAANLIANGTKIIILRRWYSATEFDYINWARGSITNGAGNGPAAGSGGRTLYTSAMALGCVSGSYTSTGAFPGANDATGNFVCAANGLRRDTANNGAVQNVIYIAV